jgi:GntR family transcriptional regulator/MocR family aminotransferase
MLIPLDHRSPLPLYRQIQDFLSGEIRSGALPAHTRLPATRNLAQSLGVNRLTITTAYEGLAADGLVYGRQGSGTYVAPLSEAVTGPTAPVGASQDWPLWQQELLSHTWLPAQYELDRMSAALDRPDAISFAAGMGDSSLFPIDDFRRAVTDILRRDGRAALSYGERAGFAPLRATIARIVTERGIRALPQHILVTSGSQQGLSLVARLLLRPGDVALVESPTYAGAIDLFRSLDVRLAGVPVDAQGMQVDRLEALLTTHHPRLIYTMPTYQNPTGTCLSTARRRQLIDLAGRYNVPILEDEFAGDLHYEDAAPLPLAALDPGGRVIYMGTFSKMLMPGLRLGFLVAVGPVYERLLAAKRVDDLSSSSLIQRALEAYITVGRYQAHLRRACQLYGHRRDTMAEALRRYLPAGADWTTPAGGLFIWLRLPGGLTGQALAPVAAGEGVGFAPGELFFPGGRSQPYVRLNFAEHPPERIEEGVRRLGRAVVRCLSTGSGERQSGDVLHNEMPAI